MFRKRRLFSFDEPLRAPGRASRDGEEIRVALDRLKSEVVRSAAYVEDALGQIQERLSRLEELLETKERDAGAAHRVARDLLPVADRLSEIVSLAAESRGRRIGKAWVDGLNLMEGRFTGLLEGLDVHRMTCVGKKFDPDRHVAVGTRSVAGAPPGTVLEEVTAGYTSNGSVLRPAEVVVCKEKENGTDRRD